MKAGIDDPYLDTLGGGERYCLTLAEFLLSCGWEVDFFWEGKNLKNKIKKRFRVNLKKVNFFPRPKNLTQKLLKHRQYDLLFHLSDGSIPFMFGKKNILHLQVPFKKVNGQSLINKIKFLTINKVVCNSFFTKGFIDKEFEVKSVVIYPPVDLQEFKPGKKENLIFSAGRFSQLLQAKRQDILVKAFKDLVNDGLRGWRLILAGGSEVGGSQYLHRIKKMTKGYPIEIQENISFKKLAELYSQAKIFWSASGFGINEDLHPERVEHFGITVVEAMAAGVVPILIKKGGFKEIVQEGKSGFFWEIKDELKQKTRQLIENQFILEKTGKEAIKRSKIFSKEKFISDVKKVIF